VLRHHPHHGGHFVGVAEAGPDRRAVRAYPEVVPEIVKGHTGATARIPGSTAPAFQPASLRGGPPRIASTFVRAIPGLMRRKFARVIPGGEGHSKRAPTARTKTVSLSTASRFCLRRANPLARRRLRPSPPSVSGPAGAVQPRPAVGVHCYECGQGLVSIPSSSGPVGAPVVLPNANATATSVGRLPTPAVSRDSRQLRSSSGNGNSSLQAP
jgi:hypothetical protein